MPIYAGPSPAPCSSSSSPRNPSPAFPAVRVVADTTRDRVLVEDARGA